MRTALAIILSVAATAIPATAQAATALVKMSCDRSGCYASNLEYRLGDGERSALVVRGNPVGVTLHDPGNVIRAGSGCVAQAADTVECARQPAHCHPYAAGCAPTVTGLSVRLGPRGDSVDATGLVDIAVDVRGLGGEDRFLGGPGWDRFFDGDRAAAKIDRDVFEGGAGRDAAHYHDRRGDLRIDLSRPARQGERGEGDSLVDVESVTGGRGDDVIRGGPGGGDLTGGDGDDVLRGGSGNDSLGGGDGKDRLFGGAGDDVLGDADGRLSCGAGRDTVPGLGLRTVLSGCEQAVVDVPAPGAPYVTVGLGRQLRLLSVDCPRRACGRIALRRAGRDLVSRRLRPRSEGDPVQALRVPCGRGSVDVRLTTGRRVTGGFRWRVPCSG